MSLKPILKLIGFFHVAFKLSCFIITVFLLFCALFHPPIVLKCVVISVSDYRRYPAGGTMTKVAMASFRGLKGYKVVEGGRRGRK